MADEAELKLRFRLVPADDQPADPVVLDDIVRLIRQAVATAPNDVPHVSEPANGFRPPDVHHPTARGLEAKIKHRIEQASAASQADVEKRDQIAAEPDGAQRLAEQSLATAQKVVAAVQAAFIQRVAVRVPVNGA